VILGVGVDIVEISRVRKSVEDSGERFLDKVFTKAEREYCFRRRDPYPSLAARFAAREALIKALPGSSGLALTDMEVVMSEEKKPGFRVNEKLAEALKANGVSRVHLSLTHERTHAAAFVVLEKGE
jgi:phosphopantetheine--protein transferase-like protein